MSFPLFLLLSSELRSWDRFEGRFPWPRTGRLTFLEWADILSLLSTLSKWSCTTCYYGCQTASCSLWRSIVLPHVTSVEPSTEAVWEQKIMPRLFLCLYLYLSFSSGSVCTWKPRLFMPPMAHCALFQPSLSFAQSRSSRNVISSTIAPLTGLQKSNAFLVLLKRCQPGWSEKPWTSSVTLFTLFLLRF